MKITKPSVWIYCFLFALLFCFLASSQTYIKGKNLIESVTSTAASAGTLTLTVASDTNQVITGATTHTITLPNATTLKVGQSYFVTNRSSGNVAIRNNGAALVTSVITLRQSKFILTDNSTANGVWVFATTQTDLAGGQVTGMLPLANGGTNDTLVASAGGVIYSGASAFAVSGVGSAGQVFQSAGTSTPVWSTATFPAVATGTGTFLRADGTNWLASTLTLPNTTTANQILYSSGTSVVGQITTAATSALVTNSSSVPSLTSGATPNRLLRTDGTTVSFAQAALATDVSGVLAIANGGTNKALTLSAGGLPYFDSDSFEVLSAGTGGQVLTSGGAGSPAWVTLVPIANGGTNSAATATAGGIGYGTGTAHAYTAAGTAGYLLYSNGASAPTFNAPYYVMAALTGANISLGSTAITAYTEIPNSALTLTPISGSAAVGTMCDAANAATAPSTSPTTCAAGNESMGISFTIPLPGVYKVCAGFPYSADLDSGQKARPTFQLIETPTNAQTLTLESGVRISAGGTGMTIATGTGSAINSPMYFCGIFNWTAKAAATTVGVRLMYEQSVTGTPAGSTVLCDAGANDGQRQCYFSVEMLH